MFTIDTKSNDNYFIIKKDGVEFTRVSKATNSIEKVKRYFHIEAVE